MEDIKKTVLEYVVEEYLEDEKELTYDSPLISGGIVDSFSMVSLSRMRKPLRKHLILLIRLVKLLKNF